MAVSVLNNRRKKKKNKIKYNDKSAMTAEARYAQLIMSPCHGPLERMPGFSMAGQIAERLRTTFSLPASSANTNGYVVVFPSYHGSGSAAQRGLSIYTYESSAPGIAPVNTTANPMGLSTISGLAIQDPVNAQLSGTTPFARAKTLSACLQLEYIGPLSNVSGQVAIITNYSLSAFNQTAGVAGSAFTPPTVDQVFSYASTRERLQIAGHEVVWRPSDSQSVFRTSQSDEVGTVQTSLPDAVFWTGAVGSLTTTEIATNPNEVMGICIAYRGIPNTANVLSFNIVKAVELELAARSGAIESLPLATRSASYARSSVSQIISDLDRDHPGWQTRFVMRAGQLYDNIAGVFAPRGASSAYGGVRGRPGNRYMIHDEP
jgi:hypothetical protein